MAFPTFLERRDSSFQVSRHVRPLKPRLEPVPKVIQAVNSTRMVMGANFHSHFRSFDGSVKIFHCFFSLKSLIEPNPKAAKTVSSIHVVLRSSMCGPPGNLYSGQYHLLLSSVRFVTQAISQGYVKGLLDQDDLEVFLSQPG